MKSDIDHLRNRLDVIVMPEVEKDEEISEKELNVIKIIHEFKASLFNSVLGEISTRDIGVDPYDDDYIDVITPGVTQKIRQQANTSYTDEINLDVRLIAEKIFELLK